MPQGLPSYISIAMSKCRKIFLGTNPFSQSDTKSKIAKGVVSGILAKWEKQCKQCKQWIVYRVSD